MTPIEDVLPGAEQRPLEDVVRRMIHTYQRTLPRDRRQLLESYRYVHAARKVVGVGSVGHATWILLLVGRDETDPLFLQFKEAQASVLEPFLGRSQYAQHGQRVVEGQRMMQAAPDILLGWERIVTIDGETAGLLHPPALGLEGLGRGRADEPGRTRGLRQGLRLDARASPRASGDRIAIAAYLGNGDAFDRAMASFAEAYADQNELDFRALEEAAVSGRIVVETGSDAGLGRRERVVDAALEVRDQALVVAHQPALEDGARVEAGLHGDDEVGVLAADLVVPLEHLVDDLGGTSAPNQ